MNYLKLLCLCVVLGCVLTRPLSPTEAAGVDWRFGVIEGYEAPGEASTLGVGWTRVRIHWAETQAGGPDTWTPSVSEAQINGEVAAGRLVVGLLIGIPDWARDGNRLPVGLGLPHDDPGNAWGNFVREAVGRYNGRINHWIIWNEPDIADMNAPGHTWDGSIQDFIRLQRTAYLVAKEVNPKVVIHLPAFTFFWDEGYIYNFFDALVADPAAAEHGYYFDVATAHLYFQPNSIYDRVQQLYGAMSSRGLPWKPVWLVETNAPPLDDPAWPVPNWTLSVTQDEQAAFMPQALASALAAGAQRVAVYKLKDTEGDRAANPEPFGLIRQDGSRRPAFTTYRIAIRYLAGMTGVARERWNEVGQIRIDQAGQSTTVLFARLPFPQQAEVAATANTALLVDMWGTQQQVVAQDGVFRVDLPPALCTQPIGDYCMIGGTTYYLVQASEGGEVVAPVIMEETAATAVPDAPAPTVVETAMPTETATAVPTVSPSHTPTRTPAATATVTKTPTATAIATLAATMMNTAVVPTVTATMHPSPTPKPVVDTIVPAAETDGLAFWFIGAGILLGLGLLWWGRNG